MPPLTGKVALVLGGCGEVGEGITRALLAAGAVVAVSSRDNNRLSELHDRLPVEWDGRYVPIHGDISSPTGVLASEHRHEPIRINALVLGTPIVSRSRPDGDADWLTSEEVGQYVSWLVSDRSTTRGQIIRFNSRSQLTDLRWQ